MYGRAWSSRTKAMPEAVQRRLQGHAGVVEHELALDPHPQLAPNQPAQLPSARAGGDRGSPSRYPSAAPQGGLNDEYHGGAQREADRQEEHRGQITAGGVLDHRHDILGDEAAEVADRIDGGNAGRGCGALEEGTRQRPEDWLAGEDAGGGAAEKSELEGVAGNQHAQDETGSAKESGDDDMPGLLVGAGGVARVPPQSEGAREPGDDVEKPVRGVGD